MLCVMTQVDDSILQESIWEMGTFTFQLIGMKSSACTSHKKQKNTKNYFHKTI